MVDHKFGGYTCLFMDEIPKELQTECSICIQVLRDPHVVDSCGYRFCKSCIDVHFSKSSNYCPMCKHQNPNTIADKLLARTLRQKKVKWTHKEDGCECRRWSRDLSRGVAGVRRDVRTRSHANCWVSCTCVFWAHCWLTAYVYGLFLEFLLP